MLTGKLIGLMVLASLSAIGPSFADSNYEQAAPQQDTSVNAWADFQAPVQQAPNSMAQGQTLRTGPSAAYHSSTSAPSPKRLLPKTSKRTNTNLSWTLPPTVTCSMTDLSLVEDAPTVDMASIIDDSYEAATLVRERAELAKDRLFPDN